MNKLTHGTAIAAALTGLALGTPAWAGHGEGHYRSDYDWDYARVISAEPVYREVRYSEPRQVCREEPVTERTVYRGQSDPGAVLVGGIIGGVIGHQFGHGRGRDAATAAGALIGASAGAQNSYREGRVVERTVYETSCNTVQDVRYGREVDFYDVTYRWHGRLYHTRTDYHPGKRIKVRMDVAPAYRDD